MIMLAPVIDVGAGWVGAGWVAARGEVERNKAESRKYKRKRSGKTVSMARVAAIATEGSLAIVAGLTKKTSSARGRAKCYPKCFWR